MLLPDHTIQVVVKDGEVKRESYYIQYHFIIDKLTHDEAVLMLDKMIAFAERVGVDMTGGYSQVPKDEFRWLFQPLFVDLLPIDEFVAYVDKELETFEGVKGERPKRLHATAIQYTDDDIFEWGEQK